MRPSSYLPLAVAMLLGAPATAIAQFEAPKDTAAFEGTKVRLGGAFTSTFQALEHSNTAAPSANTTLGAIRPGFNLPTANLNVEVQLAKGINVVVENYASSRHHQEFWVKGGYAQLDVSPIDLGVLNKIMQHTTMRVGMFEPNYGDALYRRTDNGLSTRNPFVENLIVDAFTTEPGADLFVRVGPAFLGAGVTSGQNNGDIRENPAIKEKPAFVGKLGVDQQVNNLLRVRLSGSMYRVDETPRVTLFSGDRTGSQYFGVLHTAAQQGATTANFTTGRLGPSFGNELTAYQVNPFVKLAGLELFAVIEKASGGAKNRTTPDVELNQYAADVVYRFLGDRLYVGARHNLVRGDLSATVRDIEAARSALAAGWFLTPGMLLKGEYVTQEYEGWAENDILSGGKFNGFVVQAALTF